ncbi:MAG: prephenate dehydrogenase/arogenate dehydrogenase family protein [Myxococcales bacterium]|nr:prephenate dehydrogenase/arogenate dehydrogenase family protein [Myxococcales bacterium]
MKERLVFVGFGLLASSAAAAIRQSGGGRFHIVAVSSETTCRRAQELALVDETHPYEALETAIDDARLVLLCGPILHILECLDQMRHMRPKATHPIVVSDIGSTKQKICAAGERLSAPFVFVGGHPMAGSEKRSIQHHDSSLFENAYWLITPPDHIAPETWEPLRDLIDMVGAHPVLLDPADHDHLMARLSHGPQMIASAMAAGLPDDILDRGQQHLAGRGFRDMTRIAASQWPMWRDIIHTNGPEISESLREFESTVDGIRRAIATPAASEAALQALFEKGNEIRQSLSATGKGFSHALHEVMVHLKDRPGAIAQVINPLARAGINVLDIELAKVREGQGGQLLLGFKTVAAAEAAVRLIERCGLKVEMRS